MWRLVNLYCRELIIVYYLKKNCYIFSRIQIILTINSKLIKHLHIWKKNKLLFALFTSDCRKILIYKKISPKKIFIFFLRLELKYLFYFKLYLNLRTAYILYLLFLQMLVYVISICHYQFCWQLKFSDYLNSILQKNLFYFMNLLFKTI
jgi:hypothetical protein